VLYMTQVYGGGGLSPITQACQVVGARDAARVEARGQPAEGSTSPPSVEPTISSKPRPTTRETGSAAATPTCQLLVTVDCAVHVAPPSVVW